MRNDNRTELTASWLNILAAGVISTGSVAQLVFAAGGRDTATFKQAVVVALACLAVGIALHLIARLLVGSARPE